MKSILYAGAALMIGASIYGFVDYQQTHQKKEFKEMYSEKKPVPAVTVSATNEPATPAVTATPEKTTTPAVSKKTEKGKALAPVQPIAPEDKLVAEKKGINNEPVVAIEPSKENSALKTVKKKKKLKREFFSRAPLREEEDLLIEPVKKEEKKTESKEL